MLVGILMMVLGAEGASIVFGNRGVYFLAERLQVGRKVVLLWLPVLLAIATPVTMGLVAYVWYTLLVVLVLGGATLLVAVLLFNEWGCSDSCWRCLAGDEGGDDADVSMMALLGWTVCLQIPVSLCVTTVCSRALLWHIGDYSYFGAVAADFHSRRWLFAVVVVGIIDKL
jgi:hypothetical protein